jgi:hypothetical protein
MDYGGMKKIRSDKPRGVITYKHGNITRKFPV